ncbi:MAG: alpha/beta fold hydrolase [Trueperaceae bacterium]
MKRSFIYTLTLFTLIFTLIACGDSSADTDTSNSPTEETPSENTPTENLPTGEPPSEEPVSSLTCGTPIYEFPEELYPFEDKCLDLGFGDYHYFDEVSRDTPLGTVLMVHGNPTSSFLYRDIAQDLLAQGYRVLAIDHYGFGESAKPALEEFSYSPTEHSDILVNFVDALDLQDVTLVVQDWGGPIGLGMAVRRPERIKNILIMNTWAWQVTEADANGVYGDGWRWFELNEANGATFTAEATLPKNAGNTLSNLYPTSISTQVRDAYWGPFVDVTTGEPYSETVAAPTVLFAQSVGKDADIFTTLGTLEPIKDKPVYFYFGQQDPLFGALTDNPDGSCALGTPTPQNDGTVYCTENGKLIYPYVDRFTSLWNPEKIVGSEINTEAEHFIQEYAAAEITALVVKLSPQE